jgi:integrase/recombinase XerD
VTPDRPLESCLDDYLVALRVERGLARNTIAAYERDIRQYLDFLGGIEPEGADIEQYVTAMRKSGLAPSTISRKTASIKGLHRFLVSDGLRSEDPTLLIDSPKRRQSLPKALTVDETIRLVEAPNRSTVAGRRDSALLEFMYASGARVSETVNLDLTDVDLDDRMAIVTGKGSRQRYVPIGDHAVKSLRSWLPDRLSMVRSGASGDPMFLNLRGRRLTRQGVFGIVRKHAGHAGIDPVRVSPHVLRHSAATHMVEAGADLRTVQEILGHATISTTQVYTRVSPTHLVEIYVQAHPRSR